MKRPHPPTGLSKLNVAAGALMLWVALGALGLGVRRQRRRRRQPRVLHLRVRTACAAHHGAEAGGVGGSRGRPLACREPVAPRLRHQPLSMAERTRHRHPHQHRRRARGRDQGRDSPRASRSPSPVVDHLPARGGRLALVAHADGRRQARSVRGRELTVASSGPLERGARALCRGGVFRSPRARRCAGTTRARVWRVDRGRGRAGAVLRGGLRARVQAGLRRPRQLAANRPRRTARAGGEHHLPRWSTDRSRDRRVVDPSREAALRLTAHTVHDHVRHSHQCARRRRARGHGRPAGARSLQWSASDGVDHPPSDGGGRRAHGRLGGCARPRAPTAIGASPS